MTWRNRRIVATKSRARTPTGTMAVIKRRLSEFQISSPRMRSDMWLLPDGSLYAASEFTLLSEAFSEEKNLRRRMDLRDSAGIISMWIPAGGSPSVSVPQRPTPSQVDVISRTMEKWPDRYMFQFPGADERVVQDFNDLKNHYSL